MRPELPHAWLRFTEGKTCEKVRVTAPGGGNADNGSAGARARTDVSGLLDVAYSAAVVNSPILHLLLLSDLVHSGLRQ